MITYVIPTRDRPEHLQVTLAAIARLDHPASVLRGPNPAQVIVIDNASRIPVMPPQQLGNGLPVRVLLRMTNEGAAARNLGARMARTEWLVMLDDDSAPLNTGFIEALAGAPPEVAAIGAEITLGGGKREEGGLPEVFIGCGVAIRRSVFNELKGYDASFGFYAEEYDLAARMIMAGWRIVHDRRFRVLHRKVSDGRDMNTILERLVRNNGWVDQRYTPEGQRADAIEHTVSRYRAIAEKENATAGYGRGVRQLREELEQQPRREMTQEQFDRFTGVGHVRRSLAAELARLGARQVAMVDPGKNAWAVGRVLKEIGVAIAPTADVADALVVSTLSPGPMLDAAERLRSGGSVPVVTPWDFGNGAAAAAEAPAQPA